jgi:hypothetical protein
MTTWLIGIAEHRCSITCDGFLSPLKRAGLR